MPLFQNPEPQRARQPGASAGVVEGSQGVQARVCGYHLDQLPERRRWGWHCQLGQHQESSERLREAACKQHTFSNLLHACSQCGSQQRWKINSLLIPMTSLCRRSRVSRTTVARARSCHSRSFLITMLSFLVRSRRSMSRPVTPCHVLSRPIIAAIPEANYTLES